MSNARQKRRVRRLVESYWRQLFDATRPPDHGLLFKVPPYKPSDTSLSENYFDGVLTSFLDRIEKELQRDTQPPGRRDA